MSSSTLDSVWATPSDRKRADEGLPATHYTEALRVNKDLHPESSSTSPSSTPSPSSQAAPSTSIHTPTPPEPTSSTLESRWATPYDTYKAERGMGVTKYSESLATGQNDLHRREQQQVSVKWGDQGTQVLQDTHGWQSASNSDGSRCGRDNYNSRRDGGSTSTSSSNSPYDPSQRRSWNAQQLRSRAPYLQARRDEDNLNNLSPQHYQQQPQPSAQQYEPGSAHPWNMIAMKNRVPTSTTTTNNNGTTRSSTHQYNQDPSSSPYPLCNAQVEHKITTSADTSVPCKSYKEWTNEIRQKLEKYADWKEGNDFINSHPSLWEGGDNSWWSEQDLQTSQGNDTTTGATDNKAASPSRSCITVSQQPAQSNYYDNSSGAYNDTNTASTGIDNTYGTTTTTTENQSTWNPEAYKPWDDDDDDKPAPQQQRQIAQNYGAHTRVSSSNSNPHYDYNRMSGPTLSRSSSWNPEETKKSWDEPVLQQAIQISNPIDTPIGSGGIRSPNGTGSVAGNYQKSTDRPMYGALVRQHSSPGSSSPSDSYNGGASPQWQQFKQDRR